MSLLNLDNVPGGMISGLSDDMLEWVSKESNNRELIELSSSFVNQILSNEREIGDISEEIDVELKKLEDESVPKSTKLHMEKYSNKFMTFLLENKLSVEFETIPKEILNNYLRFLL